MPMSVVYTNFGGELVHENRGGVETTYISDPLGSVIDCRNSAGTQVFSATYWPYGEIRTSTGTNPSQFDFVGALGYYRENANRAYVRARVLRKDIARWLTVDPLWPWEADYIYAAAMPVLGVDPSGTQFYTNPILGGFTCCREMGLAAMAGAGRFCKEFGFEVGAGGNGICNAMQHCLWACLIAQRCDYGGIDGATWAKDCTDMHEEDAPWWWPNCPLYRTRPKDGNENPPKLKCMDLHNNQVGIRCASSASCYDCCLQNAKGGNLEIIDYEKLPPTWRKPRTNCKRLERNYLQVPR
ncbi:MAG TPA: hypothetical protein PKA27_16580 [Fimbriimonadaceae bacterium]|nr:hypothetical protein [Fimbriimonadaceae bacterium]